MESECEIIGISSDEEEVDGHRVSEQAAALPGVKRKRAAAAAPRDSSCGDDCLILDALPTNSANDPEFVELGGELLDEIVIVGEKGQFACRDYPHPRYLCATFLFSMTPHKKHCHLCHCYVCDCPAPCIDWANHCNATHKEKIWRAERQLFKRRKREQLHSHELFDVNPALTASKLLNSRTPISLPPNVEPKQTSHHHPITQRARTTTPCQPIRCAEPSASCPKNILCEIYKICPVVISCRRRIPSPRLLAELSDSDEGG